MGGGYKNGKLQKGKVPTKDEFGGGWDYNYDEVLHGGKGRDVHLQKIAGSKDWGPNWDEDEGGGTWPNAYFFYLPRLCNHCTDAPVPRGLPERRAVQGRGVWPGPAQRGRLRRAPGMLGRLPLQEDLLQRSARRQPALHRLLPAHREGRRAGLRAPVPGPRRLHRLHRRRDQPRAPFRERLEGRGAAARGVRHEAQRLLRAAAVARTAQPRRQHQRSRRPHPAGVPGVPLRAGSARRSVEPEGRRSPRSAGAKPPR